MKKKEYITPVVDEIGYYPQYLMKVGSDTPNDPGGAPAPQQKAF